jgi:Protein of unknown function (DUF1236)
METAMQTRLFLSAAVATLSLCLAPAHAQTAPREKSGSEARQNESTAHPARQNEPGAATGGQRHGERAERNREPNEARDAQKPGEKTEKAERHGGAKKGEKHGAADEPRSPEQGAPGAPGAGPQPGLDTNKDARERTGEARPGPDERRGAAGSETERRAGQSPAESGERADARDRRGENEMGPDQRTRGAVDRSLPGGREAAGDLGRENRDQRMRVGAREQGQIRQIIERRGGRRLSPGAFDLRVGVIAPPNVAFEPLPPDVFALAPQFQGFNYAMVGDDIAIVDPSSREVVSVLNEGGPPAATYGYNEREEYRGGYREGGRRYGAGRDEEGERGGVRRERRGEVYGYAPHARLDNRQERALYRGLIGEARENLRQVCVGVGERVPESVDIEPVPRVIAAETPDVERFDYFVLNDQVVLVDPDSRIVVDIIPAPR